MHVAVIGSGVSGLVTAYLLQRKHRVELFERDVRAGGHANTVVIPTNQGDLPLDVGFIVYNERTYPEFSRLLCELDVETQSSDMSFSARIESNGFEFSSRGVRGYLAQHRNVLNPVHLRMLLDVLRFQSDARRVIANDEMHGVSFKEYLERRSFGRAFRERLIVPLVAATWSNAPADVLGFPVDYLFRFLEQHGVLAPNAIPEWRWLCGGSRSYVERILGSLNPGAVHLGEHVVGVTRNSEGVMLTSAGGLERYFDAVVLACHADDALELLSDPSAEEAQILGKFRTRPNRVMLHTDSRLLPRRKWARAAWNYLISEDGQDSEKLTMTYDLQRLQSLDSTEHYCVSVNPGGRVAPERILAEFNYRHPIYTIDTLESQKRLLMLNGTRSTYFVGAYQGYGFHEDGVQAGIRVANLLGVTW
tara:strand:+ start:218 stop:1474 length:1257 start_codon:yes stop_codon:yes gene_type:complete